MRLVDVDALNLDYEVDMADDWKTAHEIANVVKYAPTIDAVPKEKYDRLKENAEILSKACDEKEYVVRCRDCKYQNKGENESESWNLCGYRPWLYIPTSDDHFCGYGERGEADDGKD